MGRSLEQINAAVLALPVAERARLAKQLIASLDEDSWEDPAAVERAWEEELQRRLAQHRAGTSPGNPAADVFARARARLR